MDEFRFRSLEQYRVDGNTERMTLSVPRPTSPSGKLYQYSPNPDAIPRLFLIGDAPPDRSIAAENHPRIRREPGPGSTICPYSGFEAPDEDFIHFDDMRAVREYIAWAAADDIKGHLAELVSNFNRRQPRGGLLSIKMDIQHSHRPKPLAIREDLLREVRCDICQRAYEVYAISLFCPDCGSPNLALNFQREQDLIKQQIALANQQGSPELAYRLLGNAHEDVLTAFEGTLKTAFKYLAGQRPPDQATSLLKGIKNKFQNVDLAKERFAQIEIDPFAKLTSDDWTNLILNIQKRHVIGHNLSIADDNYNQLAQDEPPGETIQLVGDEIDRFAATCAAVVNELDAALLPAPQGSSEST